MALFRKRPPRRTLVSARKGVLPGPHSCKGQAPALVMTTLSLKNDFENIKGGRSGQPLNQRWEKRSAAKSKVGEKVNRKLRS